MKNMLVFTFIAVLAGCQGYKDRALSTGAQDAEADHRLCLSRGFEEGTAQHGLCVLDLRTQRAHMRSLEQRDFLQSIPTFLEDQRP